MLPIRGWKIASGRLQSCYLNRLLPNFRALAKRGPSHNRKGMGMGMLDNALDEMNLNQE